MAWELEATDEFKAWYDELPEDLADAVDAKIEMLEQFGPNLGRPHADTLAKQSRHPNMKELRIQWRGDAYRILFASIPGAWAFCSWAAASRMTDGTRRPWPRLTDFTTGIWMNFAGKDCFGRKGGRDHGRT